MRTLLTLAASLLLLGYAAPAKSADNVAPSVRITKAKKQKKGSRTLLDFYLKATDNEAVRFVFVRGKVDGKQGPWRRYDYFELPGSPYHLPFLVDCHTFTFEVYAQDSSGNRSTTRKKTFNGLR